MTHPTIRRLAALAAPTLPKDPQLEAHRAARSAWLRDIANRIIAAQKRADDAWRELFANLPDDHDDEDDETLPDPPEQAVVDALWDQVNAVVEEDRWPRELYWSL